MMDDYRSIAPLYDLIVTPGLRSSHTCMVDLLTARKCTSVIDLCCGTGALTIMAHQAELNATGVDLSPAMIGATQKNRPQIPFLLADATALPIKDNHFDAACISFALHEKPQEIALTMLSEAQRVVKAGGVILVADYRLPEPGTARLSGLGIRCIERLAGKEHHAHFTRYMADGGTDSFLHKAGLNGRCVKVSLSGWSGVFEAENS